jgi:5'-nucleotidase
VQLIRKILDYQAFAPELYNINVSTQATRDYRSGKMPRIHIVPMGVERYGDQYIKRQDPKGRNYYWSTNDPPPKPTEHETDLMALAKGAVTVTPLQFDMTKRTQLEIMQHWNLSLGSEGT